MSVTLAVEQDTRTITRDLQSAAPTLAARLLALEPGSPCLCCGSPLSAPVSTGQERSLTLLCYWCRAELTSDEGPTLTQTVPALIAAA